MTTQDDHKQDLELMPRLDYWGRRVIAVVLLFALVFTMVNVQQFAAHNDPTSLWWWTIAWLLDPMTTLTAVTAIVFEVVLADHGKPRIYWLTATKWYALGCTWAMNIWSSAAKHDPAGILLHSVAPGLVFLIAEAAPRVREHLAAVIADAKTAGSLSAQPTQDPLPAPAHPLPAPGSSSLFSPLSSGTPTVTPTTTAVTEVERLEAENRWLAEQLRLATLGHVLYRLFAMDKALLYIGMTNDPARRLREHAGRQPWWPDVAEASVQYFATRAELEAAERLAILTENPQHNIACKQVIAP